MNDKADKVRKLVALAQQQDNENEAAAAWAQAQRLATLYDLDLDDLAAEGVPEEKREVQPIKERVIDVTGKRVAWRIRLVLAVAYANQCRVYSDSGRREVRTVIYGQPDDMRRAIDLFEHIAAQCDMLAREATNQYKQDPDLDPRFDDSPRVFGRNFRLGFAQKIAQRLPTPDDVIKEAKANLAPANPGSEQCAIVRIDHAIQYVKDTSAALERKQRSLNLGTSSPLRGATGGRSGYAAGMRAGGRASLSSPRKLGQ